MLIQDVIKYIKETEGKIFSVKFIKRTTGELRMMTCRTGVTKHLTVSPSKLGVNFKRHDLISVFDMQAGGYRCIPVEGIEEIKIGGEWEKVDHE
jgi:hypothetical protein